jgi:hypothetical protein
MFLNLLSKEESRQTPSSFLRPCFYAPNSQSSMVTISSPHGTVCSARGTVPNFFLKISEKLLYGNIASTPIKIDAKN